MEQLRPQGREKNHAERLLKAVRNYTVATAAIGDPDTAVVTQPYQHHIALRTAFPPPNGFMGHGMHSDNCHHLFLMAHSVDISKLKAVAQAT